MPRSAKKMDSASMSLKAATIRLHRQASPKRGVEGTPFLFEGPLLVKADIQPKFVDGLPRALPPPSNHGGITTCIHAAR